MLHMTALPGGRQVFRWPACPRLPAGRGRQACPSSGGRSIAGGEGGRYMQKFKGAKRMKGVKIYAVIGMAVLGLLLSYTSMASEEKENRAVEAAEKWLALVDEGKYGESWETAAVYFKNAITKDKWEQMLTAFRKPLGKMLSRELKSKIYRTSLPGAPDGEYVVIQFTTSFENKKHSIETVTPMLDRDGKWRVSGYYIK